MMNPERLPNKEMGEFLDSLIGKAFDAKRSGRYDLAVKYLILAYEECPPSDLKGLLAFDVCAVAKEAGLYKEAQHTLERYARDFAGRLASDTAKEINAGIRHLELLQQILEKANIPNMPYSRLPALIKVTVEEKLEPEE